jgi:hypothetical protein
MKALLLGFGWTVASAFVFLLVAYLPAAFGVVDDYKWGRLVGGFFVLPVLPALIGAGVLFARDRRRPAFWITGLTLAAVFVLDVAAFVVASRQ